MPWDRSNFWTCSFKNSRPLSVWSFCGIRGCEMASNCSNAVSILFPSLRLTGIAHAYRLKQSITVNKYLTPLLSRARSVISTKSACHCWSIPFTTVFLVEYLRRAGRCRVYGSCANRNCLTWFLVIFANPEFLAALNRRSTPPNAPSLSEL